MVGKGSDSGVHGCGGCLKRSTAMTSSVGSAKESAEVTSRSAADMSPSICLAPTEALRRH